IRDFHVTGVQTCALPIFGRSITFRPSSSRASSITVARVIPSRMSSVTGRVINSPLRMIKRFSALPSETWPSSVKKMLSSYPSRSASDLANAALTYAPLTLARIGIALSLICRHDVTFTRRPFSRSKYGPMGTEKNDEVVGDPRQLHADPQLALVVDRTDVNVFPVAVSGQEFDGDLAEFIQAVLGFDLQDFTGVEEPFVVLAHAKDQKVLLLLDPVRPDAFKDPGSVEKSVRLYADLGLFERDKLPLEKRVPGHLDPPPTMILDQFVPRPAEPSLCFVRTGRSSHRGFVKPRSRLRPRSPVPGRDSTSGRQAPVS